MRPLFLLLLVLGLPGRDLSAQSRSGRVRGVVIDSLLGDVLPGAKVRIAQLNRSSRTDSTGRFVLDSVPPGDWVVGFTHPALDSIGVVGSTQQVRVFAGASATVVLGTPSYKPIRERLCGTTPDSLSPTVAFGNVSATDGSRIPVKVSVSWMLGSMAGASSSPGTVRTIPDESRQLWIACGIPWNAWFHASVRDSLRTASAFIHMGPRGIAAHDLVLSSRVSRLDGTILDSENRPVPGAHVSIEGSALRTVAGPEGTFSIADAPSGTMTLDVRAAGFAPWLAAIQGGSTVLVKLRPPSEPQDGPPQGSDYLRFLQRSGADGVLLLTGAALTGDSTTLATLSNVGTCRWWLDGRPVEREFFLAQPRWTWRALELYPRGEDAPPEFRASGCPIALLWTAAADW